MNALLESQQQLGPARTVQPQRGPPPHVHGLSTMNSGRGPGPERGPPDQSAPYTPLIREAPSKAYWGRRRSGDQFPSTLMSFAMRPRRRSHSCKLALIDVGHLPRFPEDVRDAIRNGTVTLEQLLDVGQDAYIRFYCMATDSFSGVRSLFTSKKFRTTDIRQDDSLKLHGIEEEDPAIG
jgi:hypothetical protein